MMQDYPLHVSEQNLFDSNFSGAAKSLQIFKSLCDNTTQSVRQLAQQTGLSKSSVHRLQQAMERRNSHPESWL